ncbi:uroporphyrinogen-III synthase [Jannaschia sp. W003]|uniref:uroporphyrinogen-III synthase n=1 Tax=Jannaschia sp. W003 TaxID=2867012 RepID=UPI0021A75DDC|nr:uroporphyrinogen-III synthase [Jannaschia sp. W003]UWQ22373.1 uroporphyrinogen-III synthase [Jannaschia sp. W003]
MTMRMPVLLTRPRPASERVAVALGVPCIIAPLLEIVAVGAPPEAEALLLTSAHGVDAWAEGGGARGLPTWCVGPRTAERARAAGLDVRGTAADAAALAAMVPEDAPPLLHARGADVRGDLAARLRARGLRVAEAVLYEARARPLTEEALALARAGPVLAPVYSPRSARLLGNEWPRGALGNLRAVALSGAVARALPVPPLAVAARPDGAAMIDALRREIAG